MPAHLLKIFSVSLALATLAGCASPAFYTQAMSGHLKMMKQREDIDRILQDPNTDAELAARLLAAKQARRFGIDELGLPDTDSYTQYVHTGRSAATWNVVAAPEFSVQAKKWCFPVSGCVPYRGYFEKKDAERFAGKMRDRGYDVSVTPAVAYSTLGWFDDPLLDTMLGDDDAQLAATIFHEMAHQQLYVKGDAAFSEGFAVFVEEKALESWFANQGNTEELGRWQSSRQTSLRFSSFLLEQRQSLQELYSRDLPEAEMRALKVAALSRMESRYHGIVETEWNGRDFYAGWFEKELNNARLALASTYRGNSCAFQHLYADAGSNLGEFMKHAAKKAALPTAERTIWLQQDCAGIASAGDL